MTDKLPRNTPWVHELITVTGDVLDEDGQPMKDELELYRRDPIDCIRELIGNPTFDGDVAYAPERVFRDTEATVRVYDEMWTGDWWWDTQVTVSIKRYEKVHGVRPLID